MSGILSAVSRRRFVEHLLRFAARPGGDNRCSVPNIAHANRVLRRCTGCFRLRLLGAKENVGGTLGVPDDRRGPTISRAT
jgi:hypothetical protein